MKKGVFFGKSDSKQYNYKICPFDSLPKIAFCFKIRFCFTTVIIKNSLQNSLFRITLYRIWEGV